MKSFTIISAIALGVSAQYSAGSMSTPAAAMMSSAMMYSSAAPMPMPSVTTTITAKAGCPTPAADVMVTRSDVPVPSCEAGKNSTKPSIISMPGYGPPAASGGMMGNASMASGTSSANMPMFTGAAGRNAVGAAMALVGGAAAYLL